MRLDFGGDLAPPKIALDGLRGYKESRRPAHQGLGRHGETAKSAVVEGTATFVSPHELEISGAMAKRNCCVSSRPSSLPVRRR